MNSSFLQTIISATFRSQRHDPNAIECFLLTAFLACNLFHAFFALNLKPEIRKNRTQVFWRSFMAAEIYAGINPAISP